MRGETFRIAPMLSNGQIGPRSLEPNPLEVLQRRGHLRPPRCIEKHLALIQYEIAECASLRVQGKSLSQFVAVAPRRCDPDVSRRTTV